MNRPALATAVLLSAALATAGCGGGSASSSSAVATPAASSSASTGTQSYASMLDLYSAVIGTGTTCSDVAIQPATTATSQSSCDLGGGRSLVLQTWRDSASRTRGVQTAVTTLGAGTAPSCVLQGVGDKGLWSVSATGDATVCDTLAHGLGGTVTKSAAAQG